MMKIQFNIEDTIEQFDEIRIKIYRKFLFDKKKQLQFLRNLERLTRTLSLAKSVRHLMNSSSGVQLKVLLDMQACTRKGINQMEGAAKWFPPEIASALMIAESTSINESLKSAISIMNSPAGNVFKSFFWLSYPLVILSIAIGLNKFLADALLKDYRDKIIGNPEYPPEFELAIHIGDFVGSQLYLILTFIVIAFICCSYFLKNFTGDSRKELDKYPIFSLYREINSIVFLRLLANLLQMNMPNLKALEVIDKNTSNSYLRYHIKMMVEVISAGGTISNAIDTGLINRHDISTITILASSRGTGYHEAIVGANEIAIDRITDQLKYYSYSIGAILVVVSIYLAINGVGVFTSVDLLYDNSF